MKRLLLPALLSLAAPLAGAQDLAGGFGPEVLAGRPAVLGQVFSGWPAGVGDLDEDGRADFVLPDLGGNPIHVAFGQADGGFATTTLSANFAIFSRVLVDDFDADGHQDLLVTRHGSGLTSFVRGHGDGSFDPSVMPPVLAVPGLVGHATGDVDGDQVPDAVGALASGLGPVMLHWLKGLGDGGFGAPQDIGVVGVPTSDLLLADLDGDGVLDIALIESGSVSVRRGRGGGAFSAPASYSSFAANGLHAADVNGDGVLDLVHGSTTDVATVLPGLGGAQFGAGSSVTLQDDLMEVTAADLDRDGYADLVGAVSFPPALALRRMGPHGPVGPPHVQPVALLHVTPNLGAADFDGDGLPDLLVENFENFQVALLTNTLGPFLGLGHSLASPQGTPELALSGTPEAGQLVSVVLEGPQAPATGLLFVGLHPVNTPFHGGLFVPDAALALPIGLTTMLQGQWPAGLPAGIALYLQAWYALPGNGYAASDAWVIVPQ
jgi:hypothetical protein